MIPKKILKQLLAECKTCILCDCIAFEFHHIWFYKSSQINEIGAILPACETHHPKMSNADSMKYKDKLKWISINKMDLKYMQEKYPKFNWHKERDRLNEKFKKG